jgi:hypothetical protein
LPHDRVAAPHDDHRAGQLMGHDGVGDDRIEAIEAREIEAGTGGACARAAAVMAAAHIATTKTAREAGRMTDRICHDRADAPFVQPRSSAPV